MRYVVRLIIFFLILGVSFSASMFFRKKYSLFRTVKGVLIIMAISIACAIIHNAIYAFFGLEDAVFFILSMVSFFSAIILGAMLVFYTKHNTSGRHKKQS